MKIKCIKRDRYIHYVTIGKIYDVIKIDYNGNYLIIDDDNDKGCYPKEFFKSLSEIRNEKIDKLLK